MHFQDCRTANFRRTVHCHMSVKSARSQQRRIKDVGTICGGNDNHRFSLLESVHFAQNLIQRLFSFIMSTTKARPPDAANGVDFVNKKNTGSTFLCRAEHVSNPARPDTHKHLDEFRSVNRKERNPRFASSGSGKQCFSRPWWPHQQHTFGDLCTQTLKFCGCLQKFHNFLQILFGMFHCRNIVECRLLFIWLESFGWTANKASQRPRPKWITVFPDHRPQEPEQEREGQDLDQKKKQIAGRKRPICRLSLDLNPVRHEMILQFMIHLNWRNHFKIGRQLRNFGIRGIGNFLPVPFDMVPLIFNPLDIALFGLFPYENIVDGRTHRF